MDTRITQGYFKNVKDFPLLNKEEEYKLLRLAKRGDIVARDRLVCCNQRFVIKVASNFQGHGLDLPELINEGNLGLIKAVDRFHFNKKKPIRFLSYAVWWVRQYIMKALYEKVRLIRLPYNQASLLTSYIRSLNCPHSDIATAKKLKITLDDLDNLKQYTEQIVSIETPIHEDGRLEDVLADESESPEKVVDKKHLSNYISRVLNKLSKEEFMILTSYYGFKGGRYTLQNLADMTGVSKERVRQRKQVALYTLRKIIKEIDGKYTV